MALTTPEQYASLRTFLTTTTDPALQASVAAQNDTETTRLLNLTAAPDFFIWRQDVKAEETGNAWLGTDIDGMSALNMQRLQLLLASAPLGIFDMSRADRRAGFENPFGTNQNNGSRVAMRAAWKRRVTTFERIYATTASGNGAEATPGTLVVTGPVTIEEVGRALTPRP